MSGVGKVCVKTYSVHDFEHLGGKERKWIQKMGDVEYKYTQKLRFSRCILCNFGPWSRRGEFVPSSFGTIALVG